MAIFYFVRRTPKLRYYGDVILILLEISRRKGWQCLKCVIVYLALDIPPFVMYCVNGKPRSSLFIESTDSMILAYKYGIPCAEMHIDTTEYRKQWKEIHSEQINHPTILKEP